jgi:tetratricopeptide (TPR) repeat protein
MTVLSNSFMPGDKFFDHFDLVTLEHSDYYPDGRDLGENYTYTSWRMSPCVKSGQLDCMHCHTSSGRYRFNDNKTANNACLPCHQKRVENATEHTHHPKDTKGNQCISCHMPMTSFGRMNRSDHSMRPPTPAATIKFKSPNACNICHHDKDPAWADKHVRQWHKDDYQKPVIELATLIDDARKQNWKKLPRMLNYIKSKDRDEIISTSLIRLLISCPDNSKWPVLIELLNHDSSELVRSSAALALEGYLTKESIAALSKALRDPYRLVRIRAASSLAPVDRRLLEEETRLALNKGTQEFIESMLCRPDDYSRHYNLGNFYMTQRKYQDAINSYELSHKLRQDSILPLNNAAFAYNAVRQNNKAIEMLNKAVALEPNNLPSNLNLALLLAEVKQYDKAIKAFKKTLSIDPNSHVAAYNLGILLSGDDLNDAVNYCRKAYTIDPNNSKYAYTFAFYLDKNNEAKEAVKILENLITKSPSFNAYALLADIYKRQGLKEKALDVYNKAINDKSMSQRDKSYFMKMIQTSK